MSKAQGRRQRTMDAGLRCRRFNQILEVILSTYRVAQTTDRLHQATLQLADWSKTVNLKVPLAVIVGDLEGADQLVGRFGGYSRNPEHQRMSPCCDITPHDLSNVTPNVCQRVRQDYVIELIQNEDVAGLLHYRQHNVWLAFFDISYGGCPYGIYGAGMPTEALHAVENGLVPYSLDELFSVWLTDVPKNNFDTVVQGLTRLDQQRFMSSSMDRYPRLLFKDGVSDMSNLSANTEVGKMFAVVVAALMRDGHDVLLSTQSHLTEVDYQNMLNVFGMQLCYWKWFLKKDNYC